MYYAQLNSAGKYHRVKDSHSKRTMCGLVIGPHTKISKKKAWANIDKMCKCCANIHFGQETKKYIRKYYPIRDRED